MQAANTMFYKVVPQRCGSLNVLCGFNTKLVFATAERVTSAVHTLTPAEALAIAEAHASDLNAACVQDVTAGAVWKKLLKNEERSTLVDSGAKSFASLGIGSYEDEAAMNRIEVYGM